MLKFLLLFLYSSMLVWSPVPASCQTLSHKVYHVNNIDGSISILGENHGFVPMSVALIASLTHMQSSVDLPARLVLFPADEPQLLAVFTPKQPEYSFHYKCHFDLGMYTGYSPPDSSLIYPLPFKNQTDTFIPKHEPNQNVYTFSLPVTTPLVAVRDGTVAFIRDNKKNCRLRRNANLIYIYHYDGTYSCYENVAQNSAIVRLGQQVKQGEVIGSFGGNKYNSEFWFSIRYPNKTSSEAAPIVFSDGEKTIPFR